ncbi:MAG: hypothetical protein FD147_2185 [Chloroflexi bacterium]|nr:MAG: hypothetical protein FD147_2185 [Chloroflexota bacterium]
MSLLNILILIGLSFGVFVLCLFPRARGMRSPLLLAASVAVIYWLQPALPIRGLDFWLPTATLLITALGWALTSKPEERDQRASLITASIITGTVLVIALTRYLGSAGVLTPTRPPQTVTVILALLGCAAFVLVISRLKKVTTRALALAIVLILLIFILLKLPQLTLFVSGFLRGLTGQSRELASPLDLRWLGFSYIAFRLIHTLRDRQSGRLPGITLGEFFIYILFFPAISAGPIDRSERFIRDLRQPFIPYADQLGAGTKRLVLGLLKKFVLADSLALIALNAANASQVQHAGWMWALVYAYTLQIFFDFSGYTDIAIGMAQLMGIRLPENFNAPYLKPNLTQFWNNWHMTLTQWFRAYFFNPLTRALRSGAKPVPLWLVILITQLLTMLLIGLWHGITLNFVLWGCWHGLGMFAQNRWSEWTRPLSLRVQARPALNRVVTVFTTLLTFQFVALGWVWFALPSAALSTRVLARLFGMGG